MGMSSASDESRTRPPKRESRRRNKKTTLACQSCQRSHYSCDEGRPCQSCVRRDKPDQCVDGVKKRAKYLELTKDQDATAVNDGKLRFLAGTINVTSSNGRVGGGSASIPHTQTVTLTPFNYDASYHRVLESLQMRLTGEGMTRVCQAFARFRAPLISHLRTLQDEDLLLMERLFQRTIIELEKILPLTGAPHCIWRRTGEVALVTSEFSILTGWSRTALCDGHRTIFEVCDERAIVSYWEQYATCVLERSQSSFRVMGTVMRPDGRSLPGAFWITVRKDIFDIPLAIVGCFLPNLWTLMSDQSTTASDPQSEREGTESKNLVR